VAGWNKCDGFTLLALTGCDRILAARPTLRVIEPDSS
jgi:hypothetical protein